MLPPLTSADLTTASEDGSDEGNNIDQKEDRKLPATQTSFKIQKSCKDDATEAKAGDKGQLLVKNTPATTESKDASKCTRYAGDKEGSKYVPKKAPEESSLNDSALSLTPKQNVARASSQFDTEKLATDLESRDRREKQICRKTDQNKVVGSNHQEIVKYARSNRNRGKALPISDSESRNRREKQTCRKTNQNKVVGSNHQRIVNYARRNKSREKALPISQSAAETNNDGVDVSQDDEGRDAEQPQATLQQKNDGVSRPGAFAVSGIGGGSGSNVWESTNLGTAEEDVSMVEDESEYFVEALGEEDLHDSICRNILKEAVEAADVVVVNNDEERAKETKCVVNWICVLLTVLGTVIGLSIGLTRINESEMATSEYPSISPTLVPTRTMIPTLETIQNNGMVRCGIGFLITAETDLCRALAAAVLGDPEKIYVTKHSFTSRWEALANESIDVLTVASTHTMDRDVYQKDTKAGFTFSAPILYDGLVFGGIPEYVDCADRLDTHFGNCSEVRICVHMGGSFHDALADNLADFTLRPVKADDFLDMFIKGRCNVLAGPPFSIAKSILKNKKGYAGEYKVGKTVLVNEPYSMVTREDDKKWSDFVNWVFLSLKAAEEQNITNATASKFMTTTVFGDKYKDMFVNAIQAVGNYGDLYRNHIEDIFPRDALQANLLNNGSTGLHFAYPLGIPNESPDPIAGSTIHSRTKEQGKLRCGIFDRVGFGKEIVSTTGTRWEGMDADYCYALSASLFEGDTSKVDFVNLTNSVDGFQALESGLVDVVAGVPLTIEGDVNETSTGKGYTFSLPYFYGGINGPDNISKTPEGALSLVTREDDSQWSDFVFWTVSATFIAEEEYITQKISDDMDGISVFGPSFVEMYRHAIGAVGNYGEIYSRHVESIEPRQGRNLLNTNPFGPQQVSFF